MTEPYGTPMPEAPKKNNTWLIVGIIAVVLLCCCAVAAGFIWYAWNNGDSWISGMLINWM